MIELPYPPPLPLLPQHRAASSLPPAGAEACQSPALAPPRDPEAIQYALNTAIRVRLLLRYCLPRSPSALRLAATVGLDPLDPSHRAVLPDPSFLPPLRPFFPLAAVWCAKRHGCRNSLRLRRTPKREIRRSGLPRLARKPRPWLLSSCLEGYVVYWASYWAPNWQIQTYVPHFPCVELSPLFPYAFHSAHRSTDRRGASGVG